MYRKREWSLWGEKVVLVPYLPHHVPNYTSRSVVHTLRNEAKRPVKVQRYHRWMQDPILQYQTGSEPLSLDQEYEMQKKWQDDNDKTTFICLERSSYESFPASEVECMVGDVNMFFNDPDDHSIAELELMIAEPGHRRKGLGLEAARLMMAYGVCELGVSLFRAKIGYENAPSLKLFQEKLSFYEVSRSSVFQEVTLELTVNETEKLTIAQTSQCWRKYTKPSLHD